MQKPRLISQAGAQRSDLEYSPQQPAECRRALNNHDPHRAAPSLLTCWLSCWRVRYTMRQKAAVLPVRSRKHHQAMPAVAGKNRLRSYEFIADAKRIIRREGRVPQRIKHPGFTDAVQNAVQRKERQVGPITFQKGHRFVRAENAQLAVCVGQQDFDTIFGQKQRVCRLATVCSSRAPPNAPRNVTWRQPCSSNQRAA